MNTSIIDLFRRLTLLALALAAFPAAAAAPPPGGGPQWATAGAHPSQLYFELISEETGEVLVREQTLMGVLEYVIAEDIDLDFDPHTGEELVLVPSEALFDLMVRDLESYQAYVNGPLIADSEWVRGLNVDELVGEQDILIDELIDQLVNEVQSLIDFMFETGACDIGWLDFLQAFFESLCGVDNRFGDHDGDGTPNVYDNDYQGLLWSAGDAQAWGGGKNATVIFGGNGIIMLPPWYGELTADTVRQLSGASSPMVNPGMFHL